MQFTEKQIRVCTIYNINSCIMLLQKKKKKTKKKNKIKNKINKSINKDELV